MKRIRTLLSAILCMILLIAGVACVKQQTPTSSVESKVTTPVQTEEESLSATETAPVADTTPEPDIDAASTGKTESSYNGSQSDDQIRVAALVGPTGIGLAYLPVLSEAYQLDLYTAPDQVTAKIINGEVDIAAVPVNLGSVLYNKTNGGVTAIAVNTLGVLYFVENGNTVNSIQDLTGKTVYATGQGSTPQYILEKILADNGLTEKVSVEYIAENAELVAKLIDGSDVQVAFIPEPQVSNACIKNENIRVALSANDLWMESSDTDIVQGIYLVRSEYLNDHPDAVDRFLSDAAQSVNRVLNDDSAPATVVERGILGAEPIAKKAIPYCNIVLISGNEMRDLISEMLKTLFDANPKSVGGKLPEDGFYYVP